MRKDFEVKNLLQVVVGIVFGYFTTFCNWGVSFLPTPEMFMVRLFMMLLSTVFIAFGIFLYMPANIMPLAGEGAILVGTIHGMITKALGKKRDIFLGNYISQE